VDARFILVIAAAFALAPNGLGANPPRGSKAFPIPVGQYASIGSGWRMKVISVRPNVSPKAAGYGSDEPAGTGTYVVHISLQFVGHGTNNIQKVLGRMAVIGIHKITYANAAPCLGTWKTTYGYVQVSSGDTTKGDVCFQDRANDAATMRLFVFPDWNGVGSLPPPLACFAFH
jgi:hypothetical protein